MKCSFFRRKRGGVNSIHQFLTIYKPCNNFSFPVKFSFFIRKIADFTIFAKLSVNLHGALLWRWMFSWHFSLLFHHSVCPSPRTPITFQNLEFELQKRAQNWAEQKVSSSSSAFSIFTVALFNFTHFSSRKIPSRASVNLNLHFIFLELYDFLFHHSIWSALKNIITFYEDHLRSMFLHCGL